MKPHKHAKLIKAWADGAQLQKRYPRHNVEHSRGWHDVRDDEQDHPNWEANWIEYRIKPEDVVLYFGLDLNHESCGEHVIYSKTPWGHTQPTKHCNLKLIWDGETKKLKHAEVLI